MPPTPPANSVIGDHKYTFLNWLPPMFHQALVYDCRRGSCMLSAGWFFRGDGPTDSENRVGNASRGLAMRTSGRSVLPKITYIHTYVFGLTETPVTRVKAFRARRAT